MVKLYSEQEQEVDKWWGAKAPPPFPYGVKELLREVGQDAQSECGKLIEARVTATDALKANLGGYFTFNKKTQRVYAHNAEAWAAFPGNAIPILPGLRLVNVNGEYRSGWTLDEITTVLAEAVSVELGFYAGIDMTKCWGDLQDHRDQPVCSSALVNGLVHTLSSAEEAAATDVNGGWDILNNENFFKIKKFEESDTIVMTKVAKQLMADDATREVYRKDGGCFSTALTPICAIIMGSNAGANPTYWAFFRKPDLHGATAQPITFKGDPVEGMALKGPRAKRRTSFFKSAAIWHRRDLGFMRIFPHGVNVSSCGSRSGALVLEQDAAVLTDSNFTDFDLVTQFYEVPAGEECRCNNPGSTVAPRWPVVLDVQDRGNPEAKPVRMALSVDHYYKQEVRVWWNPTSMRRAPQEYRDWWTSMFPAYFHLEERDINDKTGILAEGPNDPEEVYKRGDRVRALTQMAWKSTSWFNGDGWFGRNKENINRKVVIDHTYTLGVINQIEAGNNAGDVPTGHYVVHPGALGTVKEVYRRFPTAKGQGQIEDEKPSLAIQWDEIKAEDEYHPNPVFRTFGFQVIGAPRMYVLPTTTEQTTPAPMVVESTTPSSGCRSNIAPTILLLLALTFAR
jgi:hypothetical protein